MTKFISIKKANGMIDQLRNLRKQDKEMLDQVMNATFDHADEEQVMEERTKLERQIEKNTNLLLELQQEIDSMGSFAGIQEKLLSMAQSSEEKDQLLVYLLGEMETNASQQTIERINLDATRDHVKRLTEDLEEVDDAMQVMKDAYFSKSKKRLSRNVSVKKLEVTFQQALQVEPRLSPNPSPKRKRSVKQPLMIKNKHNIMREFPSEFTHLLENGCIQKMDQETYKTVKFNFELFQFLSQTAVKEYQRFDSIYIEETRKFSPKSREAERQHRNQELKMNVRASGAMERMKRENSPMLEKLKLTPVKGSLSRLKEMDLEAKSREQIENKLEKKDEKLITEDGQDKENRRPENSNSTPVIQIIEPQSMFAKQLASKHKKTVLTSSSNSSLSNRISDTSSKTSSKTLTRSTSKSNHLFPESVKQNNVPELDEPEYSTKTITRSRSRTKLVQPSTVSEHMSERDKKIQKMKEKSAANEAAWQEMKRKKVQEMQAWKNK